MSAVTVSHQIQVSQSWLTYRRVTFNNPPLDSMGPEFVLEFRGIVTKLEVNKEGCCRPRRGGSGVILEAALEPNRDGTGSLRASDDQPAKLEYGLPNPSMDRT